MKRFVLSLCLIALTAPVLAETPMSGTDFDRYTLGKTMVFAADGGAYGAEQYLPNRRVRWSFLGGICKSGEWYQDGPDICFVYEDNPVPQCWQFFLRGTGLSARFTGEGSNTVLYEIAQDDEKLECLGPEVGA